MEYEIAAWTYGMWIIDSGILCCELINSIKSLHILSANNTFAQMQWENISVKNLIIFNIVNNTRK